MYWQSYIASGTSLCPVGIGHGTGRRTADGGSRRTGARGSLRWRDPSLFIADRNSNAANSFL